MSSQGGGSFDHFCGVGGVDVVHDVVTGMVVGRKFVFKKVGHVVSCLPKWSAVAAGAVEIAQIGLQGGVIGGDIAGEVALFQAAFIGHEAYQPFAGVSGVVGDHIVVDHEADIEVVFVCVICVSFGAPEAEFFGGEGDKADAALGLKAAGHHHAGHLQTGGGTAGVVIRSGCAQIGVVVHIDGIMMPAHDDIFIGIDAAGDGGHHVVLSGVAPFKAVQLHIRDAKAEKPVFDPLADGQAIIRQSVTRAEVLQTLDMRKYGIGLHQVHDGLNIA